jgi:serine O-acetyltransferase
VTTDSSTPTTRLRRLWRDLAGKPQDGPLWESVRAGHPRFVEAVVADARITARLRGDRHEFRSRWDAALQAIRLAVVSDAFLAQVCYRGKAACQVHRIPLVPRILHRLAMVTGQVAIGDPVVVRPGVYIPHGQVVVDGLVEVGEGVVLFPWVTIGLVGGKMGGPTLGPHARIFSGAKVVGPVRVGAGAKVGANAVVLDDVPAHTTVVGAPAKPTTAGRRPSATRAGQPEG